MTKNKVIIKKTQLQQIVTKKTLTGYNQNIKVSKSYASKVMWHDQQTQYLRFNDLIKFCNLEDNTKRLLDVGCGNAELYKYLNFCNFQGQYEGWELNKKLIQQAKKRFPNVNIKNVNIYKCSTKKKYDYVVASGIFNLKTGQNNSLIEYTLTRLFQITRQVLVFNAISTFVNYQEKHLFYLEPQVLLKFCIEKLSKKVTLMHYSVPYNFTIFVFKNARWKSINSNE